MLDQIALFVQSNLMASAGVIALVLEAALRLVPSEKPKSILLAVSAVVKKSAAILTGISNFLDRVIPQNLK